jgi:hypothetical protein
MDLTNLGKPINTCLSVSSDIDNKIIARAKDFLTLNYKNHFNLSPHLSYAICPFPEDNLEKIKEELDKYFLGKSPFVFQLLDLAYEEKNKFFSISLAGEEIMKLHTDLVNLFNKYRSGCIREKDITRINDGKIGDKEIQLIKNYGYFRIFENFTPHITIGNVETNEEEVPNITKKLNEILIGLVGKSIEVDKIKVMWHTDSEVQSEMKSMWEKEYVLENS